MGRIKSAQGSVIGFSKRREWDSNPRWSYPHTRFPSVLLKPLGHLSMSTRLTRKGNFRTVPYRSEPRDYDLPRLEVVENFSQFSGQLPVVNLAETFRILFELGDGLHQL